MDGLQTVVAFAFATIPGVLVVEILEFGQPRLRERSGARSIATYLIVSAAAWALAALVFGIDGRLAVAIDSARSDGSAEVAAYMELAWRLAVAAIGLGAVLGIARWALELVSHVDLRSPFAWDGFILRLRRRPGAQLVHVRLRDGADIFGVLSSDSQADFEAEGRGLVLDVELVLADGVLAEVPGSNGIFVAPDAVATVALMDHAVSDPRGKVEE